MTTFTEGKEALVSLVLDNFTGVPAARITLDNEKFDPPADLSWVRVAVRHTGSEQESLGGVGFRKYQRFGSLFVQVFTPIDAGSRPADVLVAQLIPILEGVSLSGNTIHVNQVIPREIGPDEGYYLVVVEAIFSYDETR